MDFKELRNWFNEKDRNFSSNFYKIDKLSGNRRISKGKVILTWFLVVVILYIITFAPMVLFHSDSSMNNENGNSNISNMNEFKSFSNSYFSIDYPHDLTVKEDSDYTLFRNYDYNRWIEISEFKYGYSLSNRVDNAVTNINSGEGKTIGQPKSITVDGFKGYEIRASYPTGSMAEIFVEKNGHVFNLRFSNIDDNTKDLIIKSFKFK